MTVCSLLLLVFVAVLATVSDASALSLNAVNLYADTAPAKAQSFLKQAGFRSNTIFTSGCRVFSTAEQTGVSADIGRKGLAPLQIPLVNYTTASVTLSASPSSRLGDRQAVILDEVVELRLGPFRAETHVGDGADFTLADLAEWSPSPTLLEDHEDDTLHPLRLHLFLADTSSQMCLSLSLYPSRTAADQRETTAPLVTWVPSSFGARCGLRLSTAAHTALALAPPPLTSTSPLDRCALRHAEEFQYGLRVAQLAARARGCYYVTDMDTYRARRYVNCTFFLAVSGRAAGVTAKERRDGSLILAAAITQPPRTPRPHGTAARQTMRPPTEQPEDGYPLMNLDNVTPLADTASRCPHVSPGPGFWVVETPSCRARAEAAAAAAATTRGHVTHSWWILVCLFAASLALGALFTSAILLCARRTAILAGKRWVSKSERDLC